MFPTFPPPRLRLRLRRDVRIEESWSMLGPNRWLVERSFARSLIERTPPQVISVRFPESWSSTSLVKSGAKNTDRIVLSLTPPSLLSRGTRWSFVLTHTGCLIRLCCRSALEETEIPPRAKQGARCRNDIAITTSLFCSRPVKSEAHDVVAAVDVDDFAGDAAAGVGGQEYSGVADFGDFHVAA